jgi:hypothetical protein
MQERLHIQEAEYDETAPRAATPAADGSSTNPTHLRTHVVVPDSVG